MTASVTRRAGRILLVDAQRRVLLFRGGDPMNRARGTWWFTPGGGLDPGETVLAGAVRELFEETGLRCAAEDLGDVVYEQISDFDFAGRQIRQHSTFFLLRVDAHDVDTSGFEELEASSIEEHRWWSVDELASTADVYYPEALPELLIRLGV